MQLDLTPEEARFLKEHLARHIAEVDTELVHTDTREMQRDLAADVEHLRRIERRLSELVEAAGR
jgi:hypothetical protein